jgi:hypothetical protein
MTDEPIPAGVRDFILRHIDSVAQLEALLLMRSNPGERWDAGRMSQRIYTSEQETAELLASLAHDGLLATVDGEYRYDCNTAAQHDLVEALAGVYARHLIAVTNIIHAKPRRIRQFADAFKFRKDR